jgi:subtilisin family serine protease
VNIYIFDTGIQTSHPEFGGRANSAWTVDPNSPAAVPCQWHGTHVAGTAAGTIVGVAKAAKIWSVRITKDCLLDATGDAMIAALTWVRQYGERPAVVNLSFGDGPTNEILDGEVQRVVAAGIPVVLAAGNLNRQACLFSPARVPEAITVAASTIGDGRWSASNWGGCVDLYAPGSGIYSATLSNGYLTASGTSMAAPHVAGGVAIYMANHPTASMNDVINNITGWASPRISSITQPGTTDALLYVGSNFPGGDDTQPPVAVPLVSCPNNYTCTLNGAGSTDNAGIKSYQWSVNSGAPLTGMNTTYTVPATGTYTFALTVEDFNGNTAQATVTKSIGPLGEDAAPPVPVAGVTCPSLSCTMSGAGSTDDGGIKTYTWTVKNAAGTQIGSPIVGSTASFTAPSVGSYTFTLTVLDYFTRTGQTSVVRAVTPNGEDTQSPVAVPSVTCPSLTCNMSGNASTDDGGIQSYAWTITPGGNTRSTSVATYTAPGQGYYTFTLTVTDYFGRTGQASVTKTLTPSGTDQSPVAAMGSISAFTSPDPTKPWIIHRFVSGDAATGSTDDIGITSYNWKLCPDATPTTCVNHSGAQWVLDPSDQYLPFSMTLTVADLAGHTGVDSQHFTWMSWPHIEPPPP